MLLFVAASISESEMYLVSERSIGWKFLKILFVYSTFVLLQAHTRWPDQNAFFAGIPVSSCPQRNWAGPGFYGKRDFHFKKSILLVDLQGFGFDFHWIPTFHTEKHFGLQPPRNGLSYTVYLYVKYSCNEGLIDNPSVNKNELLSAPSSVACWASGVATVY